MKSLIKIFFSYFFLIAIILLIFFFINSCFLEYEFKNLETKFILTLVGSFIGGFFIYYRSIILEKQLIQKDEQYTKDSQFKNFLEATKMLTDKDSTLDAKISALYLLYDVAKEHPNDTERILQVLNKQIEPLINFIDGEKSNITLESINKKMTIVQWKYKGNDAEKIISNSLAIIKKVASLNTLSAIELDNSIIFDWDTSYKTNIKYLLDGLNKKEIPTKNLIFLHCIFNEVDFSLAKFHYCKFINCNFKKSNFSKANLWGSSFINCNLKNTNFRDTECEGVEFKNFFNLESRQLNDMKFENSENDSFKYLILSEAEANKLNLKKGSYFKHEEEYKEWKANIRKK